MKTWQKSRVYQALADGRHRIAITLACRYSRGTVETIDADHVRRSYRLLLTDGWKQLTVISINGQPTGRKARHSDYATLQWLTWPDDKSRRHWSFDPHADEHQRRWNRGLRSDSQPKAGARKKPILSDADIVALADLLGMSVEDYKAKLDQQND